MTRKTGIKAVVAEITAERGGPLLPGADVEQLTLAELVGAPALRKNSAIEPRRAGRPKESLNKNTEQVRRWLLQQFGDPVARLAALAAMPIDEISKRFHCSAIEAAQFWRSLQKDVAEYTAQKMPALVKVTETRRLLIARDDGSDDDALPGDGAKLIQHEPPTPSGGEDGAAE